MKSLQTVEAAITPYLYRRFVGKNMVQAHLPPVDQLFADLGFETDRPAAKRQRIYLPLGQLVPIRQLSLKTPKLVQEFIDRYEIKGFELHTGLIQDPGAELRTAFGLKRVTSFGQLTSLIIDWFKKRPSTLEHPDLNYLNGQKLSLTAVQQVHKAFEKDPQRQGARSLLNGYVVISRHPYDLMGMSFERGWTSCMDLTTGVNARLISQDIKHGTIVCYLLKQLPATGIGRRPIVGPTARALIKPVYKEGRQSIKDLGFTADPVYGQGTQAFTLALLEITKRLNKNAVSGVYFLHKELYVDKNYPVVIGITEPKELLTIYHNEDYVASVDTLDPQIVQETAEFASQQDLLKDTRSLDFLFRNRSTLNDIQFNRMAYAVSQLPYKESESSILPDTLSLVYPLIIDERLNSDNKNLLVSGYVGYKKKELLEIMTERENRLLDKEKAAIQQTLKTGIVNDKAISLIFSSFPDKLIDKPNLEVSQHEIIPDSIWLANFQQSLVNGFENILEASLHEGVEPPRFISRLSNHPLCIHIKRDIVLRLLARINKLSAAKGKKLLKNLQDSIDLQEVKWPIIKRLEDLDQFRPLLDANINIGILEAEEIVIRSIVERNRPILPFLTIKDSEIDKDKIKGILTQYEQDLDNLTHLRFTGPWLKDVLTLFPPLLLSNQNFLIGLITSEAKTLFTHSLAFVEAKFPIKVDKKGFKRCSYLETECLKFSTYPAVLNILYETGYRWLVNQLLAKGLSPLDFGQLNPSLLVEGIEHVQLKHLHRLPIAEQTYSVPATRFNVQLVTKKPKLVTLFSSQTIERLLNVPDFAVSQSAYLIDQLSNMLKTVALMDQLLAVKGKLVTIDFDEHLLHLVNLIDRGNGDTVIRLIERVLSSGLKIKPQVKSLLQQLIDVGYIVVSNRPLVIPSIFLDRSLSRMNQDPIILYIVYSLLEDKNYQTDPRVAQISQNNRRLLKRRAVDARIDHILSGNKQYMQIYSIMNTMDILEYVTALAYGTVHDNFIGTNEWPSIAHAYKKHPNKRIAEVIYKLVSDFATSNGQTLEQLAASVTVEDLKTPSLKELFCNVVVNRKMWSPIARQLLQPLYKYRKFFSPEVKAEFK